MVFAPTPPPPDLSPLRYEHPSGAFSLVVPRTWPVYDRNTTTLASAAFSLPNNDHPALTIAVINLGETLTPQDFDDLLEQYQTNIRPDINRYTEQDRQAMGDGSWRASGLRQGAGGDTEQVNTFFEQADGFIGVIDVVLPDDETQRTALQDSINSFEINSGAELQPSALSVLVSIASTELDIVHIEHWTTPAGVFFITGEVANYGAVPVVDLPIEATLFSEDGLPVADALDVPMGYAVMPGEFMPFSLRFGQGQPGLSANYSLKLGGEAWQNQPNTVIYGAENLSWTDESNYNERDELVISGTITNNSDRVTRTPRAVVTVFGETGNVVAARFTDLADDIGPGASVPFEIVVPELGGEPLQYIVTVQALP
ncbi:MAG: DUF3426 domain-containing protein [Anaerolineae bacterium]|nr:DUF3426 domain-containing protein [Anaerolineae bacterium]